MASTQSLGNFDIKSLMDTSGSYKSLIYGVLTVVVLFIIIFLGIRTLSQNQGDIDNGAVTIDETIGGVEHEVAEGESLWTISEKAYGTGFNWQIIAEANNIADPNNIEKGTKLQIPALTPTQGAEEEMDKADTEEEMEEVAMQEEKQQPSEEEGAKEGEYVVVKGDYLWKIAEAQYGDPYKWVDIARANNLSNPDLIHPGNRLKIPR